MTAANSTLSCIQHAKINHPILQGGFGNIVYFFAFIMVIPLFIDNEAVTKYAAFGPMGLVLMTNDMVRAVTEIHPAFNCTGRLRYF